MGFEKADAFMQQLEIIDLPKEDYVEYTVAIEQVLEEMNLTDVTGTDLEFLRVGCLNNSRFEVDWDIISDAFEILIIERKIH